MELIPRVNKKKRKSELIGDESVHYDTCVITEMNISSSKKPKKKKHKKDEPNLQAECDPVCYNSDGLSLVEWRLKSEDGTNKCRKTKKTKKKKHSMQADISSNAALNDVVESSVKVKIKKKKKKDKNLEEAENYCSSMEKRNPLQTESSRKKKKLKVKESEINNRRDSVPEAGDGNLQVDEVLEKEAKKKKKKKRKHSDSVRKCELTFAVQDDTDKYRGKGHFLSENKDASTDTKLDKKVTSFFLCEELHLSDTGQKSIGDLDSLKKKKKHKHKKDKVVEKSKQSSCDWTRKRKVKSDGNKPKVKKMKNSSEQVESNINEDVSSTSAREESGLNEIHVDQCTKPRRTPLLKQVSSTEIFQAEPASSSSLDASIIPFLKQECPVSVEGNEQQQMLVQSLRRTVSVLRASMNRFWVDLDQILESMGSGLSPETSFGSAQQFTEFLCSPEVLPGLNCRTFMDSEIERTATSTPLTLGMHLPAVSPTAKGFGPLPDVELLNVSKDREEQLLVMSHGRPERFAVLLFQELVPLAKYMEWNQLVNWDGSRGKMAIPANLHTKVLETVGRHFKINRAELKTIRARINELLRKPRKKNVFAFLHNIQEHIQSFQISVPETMQAS